MAYIVKVEIQSSYSRGGVKGLGMLDYEAPCNLENLPAGSASWVDPEDAMLLRTIRDAPEKGKCQHLP